LGRVAFSACGIPVDYSGTGWNLKEFSYGEDSGIMAKLQRTAILQILHWVAFFAIFGRTKEGVQALFFWWIIPVLLGYPVVNFFRNLEHADCEVSKDPNCLRNTRSVKSNPLVRLLLWDTGFHCEHHCYPMVPFYNLHKLHDLMKDSMLHADVDHFSLQNLQCVRPGGWIDGQARDMEADRQFKQKKKLEMKSE
jgi:fatty acid desaturase